MLPSPYPQVNMEQGVHAHQGSGGRVLPALQHCLPCLSPTQQPTGPTLISAPLPHWYCCEVMASTAAHSSATPHTWWTGAEAEQEQDAEEEHPAVHGSAAAKFGALQALQRAAAAARNLQNQACTGLFFMQGCGHSLGGTSPILGGPPAQ